MIETVFKVFNTRDEWLTARNDSLGASSLAEYLANGKPPQDLSLVHSRALDDALAFGSLWEKKVAQLFAEDKQLTTVKKNTPVEDLKNSEFTWHDDSFYEVKYLPQVVGYPKLHVSLDAAYRDNDGDLVVVEIKTSSATRLSFVSDSLRRRYKAQAEIEASLTGASKALIVFAHRPTGWKNMSPIMVEENLKKTLEVTAVNDIDTVEGLFEKAAQVLNVKQPDDVKKDEANRLLKEYLTVKEGAELAKQRLEEFLEKNTNVIPRAQGYVAKFVPAKEIRVMNWKKVVSDSGYKFDEADYQSVRQSKPTMSVTKDKQ